MELSGIRINSARRNTADTSCPRVTPYHKGMAKKSKRRVKQAKRRSEKRSRQEVEPLSAADRLLNRIHHEASARRDRNARLLQLEDERAWRLEERRRARGLDEWDEDE